MVAHHYIALAANPLPIVWRRPGHRIRKERKAVQLNVDGHASLPLFSSRFERRSHCPSRLRIELFEPQSLFLQRNFFQILIDGHWLFLIELKNYLRFKKLCEFPRLSPATAES